MEARCISKSGIDMLRVVVAGDHREELDIAGTQRALDADPVAYRNLVEDAIAYEAQIVMLTSRFR